MKNNMALCYDIREGNFPGEAYIIMKNMKKVMGGVYAALLIAFVLLAVLIPSEPTAVFYIAVVSMAVMFVIAGVEGVRWIRFREKQGLNVVWPEIFTLLVIQAILFVALDFGSVFCSTGIAVTLELFMYMMVLVCVVGEERLRDGVRWLYRHRRAAMGTVLAVMIAIPVIYFGTPFVQYKWAAGLLEKGDYERAAAWFGRLGDYDDAETQRQESLYRLGMQLNESGDHKQAYFVLGDVLDYDGVEAYIAGDESMLEMREKYAAYDIDSVLTMGEYGDKAIEWQVLDQQGSKRLLFVTDEIARKAYNDEFDIVSWETCTLRAWLNGEFLKTAFTDSERVLIVETELENKDSELYRTDGGNDTVDRVFLLSLDEAEVYRQGRKQLFSDNEITSWLRSPGCSRIDAAMITMGGGVDGMGNNVDNARMGVRPAIWIDLNEIE